MSEELVTVAGMLGEHPASLLLEKMRVLMMHSIPELRLSTMDVVDCREVEVLSMPTKQSLPRSDIAIRSVDTLNSGFQ